MKAAKKFPDWLQKTKSVRNTKKLVLRTIVLKNCEKSMKYVGYIMQDEN